MLIFLVNFIEPKDNAGPSTSTRNLQEEVENMLNVGSSDDEDANDNFAIFGNNFDITIFIFSANIQLKCCFRSNIRSSHRKQPESDSELYFAKCSVHRSYRPHHRLYSTPLPHHDC